MLLIIKKIQWFSLCESAYEKQGMLLAQHRFDILLLL